jgi:hypothetical protein
MLLIELRPTRLKSRRRRSAVSPMNMTLLRNGAKSRSLVQTNLIWVFPSRTPDLRPLPMSASRQSAKGALARSLWLRLDASPPEQK